MSATTSAEILRLTATFFSDTLPTPDHRRQLISAFLHRIPSTQTKRLTFISQTVETAISAASSAARSSSLHLAEKLLLSNSGNPFSSFLLSLVYHLRRRPIDAALHLLSVFSADPSLARLEIAPHLFEELFLVHFQPLLEWYNGQRSCILSSLLLLNSDNYNSDDQSFVSATTVLSRISEDQASSLKDLETDYEDLLDENCRIFADHFKDVLRKRNGDDQRQNLSPPSLLVEKREKLDGDGIRLGREEKGKSQEFDNTNRRYNPIWAEGDGSLEFNSNRTKTLSKFPSFYPERVSPKVLTNQRPLKPSDNGSDDIFDGITNSLINDNSINCSSSDSEAEQEEKTRKTALFDSRQNRNKPISSQELRHSPDPFMEDIDNPPGNGKQTPPKDFVCPITTHVFNDPVTLETGQTYERRAIQEWIDRGNSTCPITRQNLHSTNLPKTNYVLKRLIGSWQEQNPGQSPVPGPGDIHQDRKFEGSVSPDSVISQAAVHGNMSELRNAITDLCTSEILKEAETAVLKIERFWREMNMEMEMQSMLSKPPVINGFVEILFNSVDTRVLRAAVVILTELGSRDDAVIQTLTRVDSDVECVVQLAKKGFVEAVVLVHLLKPSPTSLIEMDVVDSLLATMENADDDDFQKMCVNPRTASVILLGNIVRCSSEESISDVVRSILSRKAIETILGSLKDGQMEERICAVSILLACMLEDGKSRNVIADKVELRPILESFVGVNDGERFEIVHFLSELVKLNRRSVNEKILHVIKDEGTFSTMHTLLIYLQHARPDQSTIVAGLLLQLDLLDEPRKMSIYREEAMDTLISCLRISESPSAQISAAETLLSLQGRFSYSGKSLARAILLKRAGLDRIYKAFMRKDQRRHNISSEIQDTMEEKACEEWEKKAAFVLASHEFGLIFEALAEGVKSRYEELRSVCIMLATWLVYMLSNLPDTGVRGAARACLLKHFVSIFKTEKSHEDRALSMLALNSFIHDPDGLQDLIPQLKDILKGLRELKKSSSLAFQMLKVLSEEHDNSAHLWNHKELIQEDCSTNGEVLTITCFKGKIFSGHSDGTIKVWACRGSELRLLQEVQEHIKAVTSLTILNSLEKLYSGSIDKTLRVWLVTEEGIQCEQVIEMKDQINNLVVANSMACYIPQGGGVKVYLWNGSSKSVNQNKYVKCVALVQGKLYCGCLDNSIQEIDLVTGTVGNIQNGFKKLLGKANPINALQVNDGLIYAAASPFDGPNVKIFNSTNYGVVGSLPSTLEVRSMAVSSELIYLGCKGGAVEVWCKKKYNKIETLQTNSTSKILCMDVDANEDMLVIGTADGRIQMWGLS